MDKIKTPKPSSRENARKAAAANLKGPVPMTNRVMVILDDDTHGLLFHFADEDGVTRQDIIRTALSSYLASRLIV